ncbi:Uncharacterised protein [Escherichia coli]|uniref:Uncharacterized protein n=1 Tax=Escherichia coli TaxID=562 RepID=A0A2X3K0P0_ECOLX|nr:Uncharacterised protein [Escherichia coli]
MRASESFLGIPTSAYGFSTVPVLEVSDPFDARLAFELRLLAGDSSGPLVSVLPCADALFVG